LRRARLLPYRIAFATHYRKEAVMRNYFVLSALFLTFGCVAAHAELPEDFILVAHRGVVTENIPENSLASLEETIRRGYTHIEVDLRVTRDGHAVVLHDRNLARTTGIDRNLDELTLAELREIVDEDRVPSFAAFAERCAGRIELMPDVKDVPREFLEAFADSIESTMRRYGVVENALFIGRKDVAQRFWGEARSSWRQPIEDTRFDAGVAENPGRYHFVFGHAADFTEESVKRYQEMGLEVIVSINTFHYREGDPVAQGLDDVRRMLDYGVDGLQIDSVYEPALPE
jgi:glycerophosphoryl diester phosphodiesterase